MRTSRKVTAIAVVLVVAALVIRGAVVATGNFYWDDLVLIGRASTHPIWSWDFLGADHDGHFMPAAFLLAGLSTVIAPLNWAIPAVTLVVLQAIASVAVWRMIVAITGIGGRRDDGAGRSGREVGALVALCFYLFTPMTLSAFTWWAAGLNSLPMQAAMAYLVTVAVRMCRGEVPDAARWRTVVLATVAFVVALAFFEKSLFILPVAFVAAVFCCRRTTDETNETDAAGETDHADDAGETNDADSAVTRAFTRGRPLWAALGVVFVAWIVLYFSVADATAGVHSATQTLHLVWRSIDSAVIPSFVGGPWDWERWVPSPPMGFPPIWMVVIGWLLVVGAVWWSVTRRVGAMPVIVAAAVYVVLAQVPAMWNRSSPNTALELAQTMRYLPDAAVVITIAIALVVSASVRRPTPATRRAHAPAPASGTPKGRTPVLAGAAVGGALLVASSLISVAEFSSAWRDDPTGAYLANAKRSLAADRDHPMFDQSLPLQVLLPVAYPENQISHTFGRLTDRPRFGRSTDVARVLDDHGDLVPGAVTQRRTVTAGRGTCARPETAGETRLRLDGPLLAWRWTVQLPYCATTDGTVELATEHGSGVRVPVRAGLHVVYVQLDGSGTDLRLRPVTPGLRLHTGEGRVGEMVDARLNR